MIPRLLGEGGGLGGGGGEVVYGIVYLITFWGPG